MHALPRSLDSFLGLQLPLLFLTLTGVVSYILGLARDLKPGLPAAIRPTRVREHRTSAMILLLLHLLLSLQRCSSYRSPTTASAPSKLSSALLPSKSACKPGRSTYTLSTSAAANSPSPEDAEGGLPERCDIVADLHGDHGREAGFSAVLANYPRSPFSKIGPNSKKRMHTERRENIIDRKGLTRLLQQPELHENKVALCTPEQNERENVPEVPPPEHQEVQRKMHKTEGRLKGFLSTSPTGSWLCAGRVCGAHGLLGQLKIEPTTFAKTARFCTPGA